MLGERVVRVTVKPFMDMNTMIEERLTQCCVHVGDGQRRDGGHQCAPVLRRPGVGARWPHEDLDRDRRAAHG